MTSGRTGRRRRRQFAVESLESRDMLTLAITEINYHPVDPQPALGESADARASDYEFIELMNRGDAPLNLSGYQLIKVSDEGVEFTFPAQVIAPEERIVVIDDKAAAEFRKRYGNDVPIIGGWKGGLSNNNEQITLVRNNILVEQFVYKSTNKWPTRADGLGASLERKDFVSADMSDSDVWRSSIDYGGSPGRAPGSREPDVIINEILPHTDPPFRDLFELHNTTDAAIDISGWYVTDSIVTQTRAFAIPDGTVLPAQGYVTFTENDFNPGNGTLDTDFAFSERGEPAPDADAPEEGGVWLLEAAADGRPSRFADRVTFGATENGTTVGNVYNQDVTRSLYPLASWTRNAANEGHRIGNIVISEVVYHSPVNDSFGDDDVYKEFIELSNPDSIFDVDISNWQIEDAIDIQFSPGTTIEAGSELVIVAFNPQNEQQANEFRSYYGINENVKLYGPWGVDNDGALDRISNNGERITLTKPEPDTNEDGTITILQITVDQVDYEDDLPWPEVADGDGGSLERNTISEYGNFSTSWISSVPTPGNQPFDFSQSTLLSLEASTTGNIGRDGDLVRGLADVDMYRFSPQESGSYLFRANGPIVETPEVSNVAQRVSNIVAQHSGIDPEQIAPEMSFADDLAMDLVDKAKMIINFEQEFAISIPDEVAENVQTVGQAIESVEKLIDEDGTQPFLRLFHSDGVEISNTAATISAPAELSAELEAGQEYWVGVNGNSISADMDGQPVNVAGSYDPLTGRNITAATVNDPLNYVGDYELGVETIEVLPSWQNPANPLDVNHNSSVEPLDALIIINRLNQGLGGSLPAPGNDGPPPFFDVNGNDSVEPLDALIIINFLNQQAAVAATPAIPNHSSLTFTQAATETETLEDQETVSKSRRFDTVELTFAQSVDLLLEQYERDGHDHDDVTKQQDTKSTILKPLDLDGIDAF